MIVKTVVDTIGYNILVPLNPHLFLQHLAGNIVTLLLHFLSLNLHDRRVSTQGRPQNFFQGGSKVILIVQGGSKSKNFAV